MKSSGLLIAVFSTTTIFQTVSALAAHVDMKDPRRALGREDDVRIDAQLIQDTVSSGSPIGITYQIENLSRNPVAVADKVCDLSYDLDSRTIEISVGAEVPKDGRMPRLVVIAPGEKKTFTTGGILHVNAHADGRTPFTATPRFVQIRVSLLRELAPFQTLIDQQVRALAAAPPLSLTDQQFDAWVESSDTIFLNAIPVRFTARARDASGDASQRQPGGGGSF